MGIAEDFEDPVEWWDREHNGVRCAKFDDPSFLLARKLVGQVDMQGGPFLAGFGLRCFCCGEAEDHDHDCAYERMESMIEDDDAKRAGGSEEG